MAARTMCVLLKVVVIATARLPGVGSVGCLWGSALGVTLTL